MAYKYYDRFAAVWRRHEDIDSVAYGFIRDNKIRNVTPDEIVRCLLADGEFLHGTPGQTYYIIQCR